MIPIENSFIYDLYQVSQQYKNRPAICINSVTYTYLELFTAAIHMAEIIKQKPALHVAVLMRRHISCYVSILAIWFAGKVYVPLNPLEPISRLKQAISSSYAGLILGLAEDHLMLNELMPVEKVMLLEPLSRYSNSAHLYLKNNFVHEHAYLMFTSGSTGTPKGVMITQKNLKCFIHNILARTKINAQDRCSQITELSFDFSIYEIFACWSAGACLCVANEHQRLNLARFIHDQKISFWASLPSTITYLNKIHALKPNSFPTIRYSIFCGEILSHQTAMDWFKAAPSSVIDNLYGPTESTVAITGYVWNPEINLASVPIGQPFYKQEILIVDEYKQTLKDPEDIGELVIAGDQVINQYWPEQIADLKKFIQIGGRRWYCTGDLVQWSTHFGLLYKGRCDDQLKLQGYRVEKQELEMLIKNLLGADFVAIIFCWDTKKLTGFLAGELVVEKNINQILRAGLPSYMVPDKIIILEDMPRNKNGKIDYFVLQMLNSQKLAC